MTDGRLRLNKTEPQRVRAVAVRANWIPPCFGKTGNGSSSGKVTWARAAQEVLVPVLFLWKTTARNIYGTFTYARHSTKFFTCFDFIVEGTEMQGQLNKFPHCIILTVKWFLFSWANSYILFSPFLARLRQQRKCTKHDLFYPHIPSSCSECVLMAQKYLRAGQPQMKRAFDMNIPETHQVLNL